MSSAVTLAIFNHLFASVAEEMGVTLERSAYSPNIKERRDFSCAVFLATAESPLMLAQAAHIPVHLGAMPASIQKAVAECTPFEPGDVVILNDPYQGGNHLPDITMISPVFDPSAMNESPAPLFYVASRAHHADVGGMSPGSMPLSTELFQEGIIIPPIRIIAEGKKNKAAWDLILRNVRTPIEREGDLTAQLAAHRSGSLRLEAIIQRYGVAEVRSHAFELISYAERLTRTAVAEIPDGNYSFVDYLDDDGQGSGPLDIRVTLTISKDQVEVDFTGTAAAVRGNVNAVPAIVESAAAYCIRCVSFALLDLELPMNAGMFEVLNVKVPAGSLLNPPPPHAVAAGNVETSQRIVDVIFGALGQALPQLIPAASQGTMNNLTFGGSDQETPFAYYETIGGGAGAGPGANGASGIHVHMSNTLNTPVEALEYSFPVHVQEYSLRKGSGGSGVHYGGEGIERSIQFLVPVNATINSERRIHAPYGAANGEPGQVGKNTLIHKGHEVLLPGKVSINLEAGDILKISTPGGGGWGREQ
ncbi:MAG: hydantoinase B/oxoprolinase family protein [Candidatus Promineifilaceae bacterium]|nr:hydantoinase B/oxoprolinase family protein [Candidatus Promineifilaceae bacterium]